MTVLYLTDGSLDPQIAEACRANLLREAEGMEIVSVSQEPLAFGRNVCVGRIGRSWLSLYTQLLRGLEAVNTETVTVAEHDVLYTREHLQWKPLRNDVFYYNTNCWLVQWGENHPELNGMYSYWPRRIALSQLVCHKDLLRRSTEEILRLLDMGLKVERGQRWYGEPGVVSEKFRKAFVEAQSGRPTQLQAYLKEYVTMYRHDTFQTANPNVDIRHGSNFTGPKRGKKRTYTLPYWGEFKNVISPTD